jgi:UDP-sulfoquinovose synthase
MAKKILILGMDGYLGWTLAVHLASRGDVVFGYDNHCRRIRVSMMKSKSAIPLTPIETRIEALKEVTGASVGFERGSTNDIDQLSRLVRNFQPDAVVNLAQQPSAPWSMANSWQAATTQMDNVVGNLNVLYTMKEEAPDAHLIQLGTMGEYGTPNVDIPEGEFEFEFRGRWNKGIFPRDPGSFYHASKVHATVNTRLACKLWGLRATDIMQGVVFGATHEGLTDPRIATRLDFDECFGTVLNRFLCQAVIGMPLTPYGSGNQTRGYLMLKDAMQCLTIGIDNPAEAGKCRAWNQFAQVFSVMDLACMTASVLQMEFGIDVKIQPISNLRVEQEEHYYKPDHQILFDLGFKPDLNFRGEITRTARLLLAYKNRIASCAEAIMPRICWKKGETK